MIENKLSEILREDAKRLGLSEKEYKTWGDNESPLSLINRYKSNANFCVRRKWPSKEFICRHFDDNLLTRNGVLIDKEQIYPLRDGNRRLVHLPCFVLLGSSKAQINYAFRPHKCDVWVTDESVVVADAKYGAFIEIHLFGHAKAIVTTDLVSKIMITRHSQHTNVNKEGIVTVLNEFHYLE